MMAAFLSRLLSRRLPLAHTAILEIPLSTIFVAGTEKGRLRREVMRFNLKRRFFFPSDVPPSTSQRDRLRLRGRLAGGRSKAAVVLSKVNLMGEATVKVNAKVLVADLSFQECPMLTVRGRWWS